MNVIESVTECCFIPVEMLQKGEKKFEKFSNF